MPDEKEQQQIKAQDAENAKDPNHPAHPDHPHVCLSPNLALLAPIIWANMVFYQPASTPSAIQYPSSSSTSPALTPLPFPFLRSQKACLQS